METHYTPEQARRYIASEWPEKLGQPTGVPTWTVEGRTVAVVDAAGWCPEVADDYAHYCYERLRMGRGKHPQGEWRIPSRLNERAAEEHDLGVLANLYELLRWLACGAVPRADDIADSDKDAEDAGSFFERKPEISSYFRPLLRAHLGGEIANLAEKVGELCWRWGAVHQQMDEHLGRRSDSRRPFVSLVQSLWNHPHPEKGLTETEISMVLMGLDVPQISKTVAPGFETVEGGEEKWFQFRTVLNVVRKAVQENEGSKRRRAPEGAQGPTNGEMG